MLKVNGSEDEQEERSGEYLASWYGISLLRWIASLVNATRYFSKLPCLPPGESPLFSVKVTKMTEHMRMCRAAVGPATGRGLAT